MHEVQDKLMYYKLCKHLHIVTHSAQRPYFPGSVQDSYYLLCVGSLLPAWCLRELELTIIRLGSELLDLTLGSSGPTLFV